MALISSHSVSHMLIILFSGIESRKILAVPGKDEESCCLAFAFLNVSYRSRATTANKCIRKHDGRNLKVLTLRSPKVNTLRDEVI